MNKKAMELSINFIVILIITIVIFASSIFMTAKFFKSTTDYQSSIDENTEAQIRALLSEGSRVAIPLNNMEIKLGHQNYFALGIANRLRHLDGYADFDVNISFAKAYTSSSVSICADSAECPLIEQEWLLAKDKSVTLKNNEDESIMIMVQVGSSLASGKPTEAGTYIFDVEVKTELNGVMQLYDGHIHKFYVTVP